MSYGKIIGYALAGVSALAGTYIFGKDSGKKVGKKEGREDGYKEAKAQHANEMYSLKLKLAVMMKDIAKRDDFVLCAYGLGLSYLNANGSLSAEKTDTLSDLVSGIGKNKTLSQQTQERIKEMTANPPNLHTVWTLIKERDCDKPEYITLFNQIVDVLASLDERPTQRDLEFVAKWNTLAAVA